MSEIFLIALGSNRWHHRHGAPRRILAATFSAMAGAGIDVLAASPIITSRPVGPSRRAYANAVAVCECDHRPDELLAALKSIEAQFGQRRGQRWSARTLDLDIIAWSGGIHTSAGLAIPHPAFRNRDFVLRPATAIAPDWQDPVSGLKICHLWHRLQKRG